jgi:hypothetical protein
MPGRNIGPKAAPIAGGASWVAYPTQRAVLAVRDVRADDRANGRAMVIGSTAEGPESADVITIQPSVDHVTRANLSLPLADLWRTSGGGRI